MQVRRIRRKNYSIEGATRAPILELAFSSAVTTFVGENSEGGKRAQAVAAGLLDIMYSREEVLVSRVNDPDRHFPGDVGVTGGENDKLERAFEVRDKLVTQNDLFHFVRKVAERGVSRAAVVAIAADKAAIDISAVATFAQLHRVKLAYFTSWAELIGDVLFYGSADPVAMLEGATTAILTRLVEIEASAVAIDRWISIVAEIERLPAE